MAVNSGNKKPEASLRPGFGDTFDYNETEHKLSNA